MFPRKRCLTKHRNAVRFHWRTLHIMLAFDTSKTFGRYKKNKRNLPCTPTRKGCAVVSHQAWYLFLDFSPNIPLEFVEILSSTKLKTSSNLLVFASNMLLVSTPCTNAIRPCPYRGWDGIESQIPHLDTPTPPTQTSHVRSSYSNTIPPRKGLVQGLGAANLFCQNLSLVEVFAELTPSLMKGKNRFKKWLFGVPYPPQHVSLLMYFTSF